MSRFAPHPELRPAVVTGASSGIGRATAIAIADLGHPVVLGARRVSECEDTAAEIRANGGDAFAIHLDLADGDSIKRFAAAATDTLGNVEILAMLPEMTERARGDVVFVTSDVAVSPRPSMAAYVTSKWGLEGYARSLQMELEGTGVRATIVRPGPTLTGMGMDWDPDVTAEVIDQWVSWGFGRHSNLMRPQGVAQAIVAAVTLPRGTHATTIELQPEAPIREIEP
jgi:NADP-dependent 3-hydroxy acid dehydrogenase YdfG